MPIPASGPKIDHVVCLAGLYPAVSHTFVLREIVALRAAGLRVTTCSVNRPDPRHLIGPDEALAARSTFYLLEQVRRPGVLLAAMAAAARRPRRLAKAVALLARSGSVGTSETLRQLAYLLEAMVLARFLQRCGATRIHNQLGMASASVGMYAAILAGIPFSLTLHGPDDFFDGSARQLGTKIASADLVACISDFCRKRARELCSRKDWTKLHIVRCGIDPAAYSDRDRSPPLRRILFVGRLEPVKGVSVLIHAFGSFAATFPDAILTIVGDGSDRVRLESDVSRLGLENRVLFTGSLGQKQVAARMAEADMFVLPSFAEGLPVVLMEAMASGLPVISTDVAGIPELVENTVTGRLVRAGDEEQLATAMHDHLTDPQPALEMARRGRGRALDRHDMWEEGRRLARLFGRDPSLS